MKPELEAHVEWIREFWGHELRCDETGCTEQCMLIRAYDGLRKELDELRRCCGKQIDAFREGGQHSGCRLNERKLTDEIDRVKAERDRLKNDLRDALTTHEDCSTLDELTKEMVDRGQEILRLRAERDELQQSHADCPAELRRQRDRLAACLRDVLNLDEHGNMSTKAGQWKQALMRVGTDDDARVALAEIEKGTP